MNSFLGAGNGWTDYLAVLLIYLLLFIVMRYANRRVELNFKKSARVLGISWALAVFIGNYAFYKMGIMSFHPGSNALMKTIKLGASPKTIPGFILIINWQPPKKFMKYMRVSKKILR